MITDLAKESNMYSEFEPMQQSFLSWVFAALGVQYLVLLTLAGLFSFVFALIVVLRGRGPMAAAALLLIVHVPLLIGLFAAIQGAINSYTFMATSGAAPIPSEVAKGISTALVAPMVAMILLAPGYAIATIGSIIRSLSAASNRSENS